MSLTPKQEAFCLAYIETGNASEAYRQAGYSTKNSPKTINECACKLLANPKVNTRVKELQTEAVKRNAITVDDLILELQEARMIALSALIPQSSAAISATLGKAKMLGFLNDKLIVGGDPDNPITVIERVIVDAKH